MANIRPNRLRELRERSRLTQIEVAKLLDLDHTTVARHEAGERALTPEQITAYARLFKVASYEVFLDPGDLGEEGDV